MRSQLAAARARYAIALTYMSQLSLTVTEMRNLLNDQEKDRCKHECGKKHKNSSPELEHQRWDTLYEGMLQAIDSS